MRHILIYFSLKYKGDYVKIIDAIKKREIVSEEDINKVKNMNLNCITFLDEDYPICLKRGYASPLVIYYEGDKSLLYESDKLSVIGSREPTYYGIEATKKVVNELLDLKDVVIVSGMAKGIDSIAHEVALKKSKKTIAVLGNGPDICYPQENILLYNDIKENGLIISEYPFGVHPNPKNFLLRNRIIAALSKGVLVCDAKTISGTQNTVKYALELNKEVLSIPHPISYDSFCNKLIKDGATVILSGKDIVEEIF